MYFKKKRLEDKIKSELEKSQQKELALLETNYLLRNFVKKNNEKYRERRLWINNEKKLLLGTQEKYKKLSSEEAYYDAVERSNNLLQLRAEIKNLKSYRIYCLNKRAKKYKL